MQSVNIAIRRSLSHSFHVCVCPFLFLWKKSLIFTHTRLGEKERVGEGEIKTLLFFENVVFRRVKKKFSYNDEERTEKN